MSRLPQVVHDAIAAAFVGGPPTRQLMTDIAELSYTFGREDAIIELDRADRERREKESAA